MCAGAAVNARLAKLVYGATRSEGGRVRNAFTYSNRYAAQSSLRNARWRVVEPMR
jgi:tRNA(Arg) A34 adenosine deaminase TadA